MEENNVESNVNVSEQAIDEPAVDEVAIADLLNESSESTGQQPEQPVAHRDGGAKDERQQESRAFSERLKQARAKDRANFENEPAYLLGKALINQRMAQDSVDEAEAVRRINGERAKQQAAEYKEHPEAFYLDMINGRFQQNTQANNTPDPDGGYTAKRISDELIDAESNGYLPAGFNPSYVTKDFINDVQTYGTRAALELWSRSHSSTVAVVDELQRRSAAPQPMRTQGQASPAPKVNIKEMSDKDFKKLVNRMKQETQKGKRVTFN